MNTQDTSMQPIVASPDTPDLDSSWTKIQTVRLDLANELQRVAALVQGDDQRQLKCWAAWFREDHDLNDALHRPDILGIVLPMIRSGDDDIDKSTISQIAQRSLNLASVDQSVSRRLWQNIRYPVAVVIFLGCLWLCFVVGLAPSLRDALFEYWTTDTSLVLRLVVGQLPYLHTASWFIVGFLVLMVPVILLACRTSPSRAPNTSWLDTWLTSTRCAVGKWAWHVSLLLQSGKNVTQAATIAGYVSKNQWVKSRTKKWLEIQADPSGINAKSGTFSKSPFKLVNSAILVNETDKQASFLKQAAKYYFDRDKVVGDWWFRILAWLILWNVFVAGAIVFIAFYGTLLSLIDALTSW